MLKQTQLILIINIVGGVLVAREDTLAEKLAFIQKQMRRSLIKEAIILTFKLEALI